MEEAKRKKTLKPAKDEATQEPATDQKGTEASRTTRMQEAMNRMYAAYKQDTGLSLDPDELKIVMTYIAYLHQQTTMLADLMDMVESLTAEAAGTEDSDHDCTGCGACVDEEDAYASTAPNKKITWN